MDDNNNDDASFVIIQHNRFENTKKAYLSDDGKARMDTTDTAVVGCYFDAISSIEKGRVLPIKVILTCNSHISQNISLTLPTNLCYMYDLDKLIRENNVTDECGLDLVYELCQGKWNDFKTKILHKEVFSNPVYLGRLHKSAKAYNIGDEEDILDILNGFELFLRQPLNVKKLMQPLLDGCSFDDALSDLFSMDYLPYEVLLRQEKVASVPKQVAKTVKHNMPEEQAIKDDEGYEKLNSIIAKGDDHVTLQDLMGLVPESATAVVKEEWHMKDGEDTVSIFEHYCYHLAKKSGVFLEEMRKKVCKGQTLEQAVISHFKSHYVEKGKELITKKNERTELMTDENKRRLFFSLVGDDVRRERFFWIDQGKKSGKTISKEVKKVFRHLLYPQYCIVSEEDDHSLNRRKKKETLCFPNKEMEEKVLSQIDDKEEGLREDLRKHLEGEHGKSLIMNYYFNKDFQVWFEKLVYQYVEAKARINEFLNDETTLFNYLSQETEFWPTLEKLSNKFDKSGRVAFVEKGEMPKGKNKPQLMLQEDDIRDKFYEYFREEVDFQGRKVHRFIRDFSCFHYDGSLSGWMNTTCFRFLLRYKVALEAEWKTKPFSPHSASAKRFKKLLIDYEKELKANKKALRVEDCIRSKKGKELPKAQLLRNWLAKHGFDTIEEVLDQLPTKDIIPNQKIVINSVLVSHAWKFFGFKKQNFENVDIMRKSIEEMEVKGEDWRFFDTSIVNVSSEDLIDVSTLKAEQVGVLPRLVAICHVISERNNEKGKKAALYDEKTTYDELGRFYGVNEKTVKTWTSRGGGELVERVGPLVEGFENRLKDSIVVKLQEKTKEEQELVKPIMEIFAKGIMGKLPVILRDISCLFNKGEKRDSLNMDSKKLDSDYPNYTDGENIARYVSTQVMSDMDEILTILKNHYSEHEEPSLSEREVFAGRLENIVMENLVDVKYLLKEKLRSRETKLLLEKAEKRKGTNKQKS